MQSCKPIDITINHDWDKTILATQKLLSLKSAGSISDYGNSVHYDLKSLGTISEHKPSGAWFRVASPVINKTMPWLDDFLNKMEELNPDEGAISYLHGKGAAHIDLPHMQTSLNYIFKNSDSTAHTWIESDNIKDVYPSQLNTAWLLDTQKLHGIENDGHRWTLTIHFNTEYDVVCKWFEKHPKLIFEHKG
jgi:hypothetical protein